MSEPIRIFIQHVPGGRPLEVGVFQPPANIGEFDVHNVINMQHAAWLASPHCGDIGFAQWLNGAGWTSIPKLPEHVIWFTT